VTSCGERLEGRKRLRIRAPAIHFLFLAPVPSSLDTYQLFHGNSLAEMPASTPPTDARFASSTHTAEDLLKEQTVGLVHYSDFRKRRAEALEQQSGGSGTSTPTGNESRYVLSM
jgi:hypothetical protein